MEASLLGDEPAGLVDPLRLVVVEKVEAAVGAGRRLLDQRQGADEIREVAHRHAGDREVLDRPLGVDAPIGVGRHVGFAEQIVLAAGRDICQRDRLRGGDLQGGGRVLGRGQDGVYGTVFGHGRRSFRVRVSTLHYGCIANAVEPQLPSSPGADRSINS